MLKNILKSTIYQPTSNIENNIPYKQNDAFDEIVSDNEVIEINNATVCMIDICGFSTWCANQLPKNIVHTMSKYNLYLSKRLEDYTSLKKLNWTKNLLKNLR